MSYKLVITQFAAIIGTLNVLNINKIIYELASKMCQFQGNDAEHGGKQDAWVSTLLLRGKSCSANRLP